MKNAAHAIVTVIALISAMAYAADNRISQKGRVFSQTEIAIKKGQEVIFVNDDNVPHNVMSMTKGNEFNLGAQAPGTSTPVTFTSPATVQIMCAIHPRMKMTVKVTE